MIQVMLSSISRLNSAAIRAALVIAVSAAAALAFGALTVHAQADTGTATTTTTYLVADVSLQDCSSSVNGSSISITCGVTNAMAAQPNIRYSVLLIDDKTGTVEDQKVYPDSISLDQNQSVTKTFTYQAPPFPQGTYDVWVSLSTVDSLPLDSVQVGQLNLPAPASNYILIAPDSCYLTIAGDSTKYPATQGVDFGANDAVTLTCSAQNLSKSASLTATPSFETHLRTLVGPVVSETQEQQVGLSLNAGAKQTVSFTLPKALSPQAYDTLLTLQGPDGTVLSNTVRIHYVLDGASATIQLLTLDKNYYASGDTAQVTLWWTGSADSFDGARNSATDDQAQTAELTLVDGNGNQCAAAVQAPVSNDISSAQPMSVPISVTKDCSNPSVTTSIVTASGTVLATKSISLTSTSTPSSGAGISNWVLILIALVLLGLIALGIRQSRKNRMMQSGVLLLLLLVGAALPHHASAATYTRIDDVDGSSTHYVQNTYTASLNKSSYAPGAAITVSGSVVISECNNGARAALQISGMNSADGVSTILSGGYYLYAGQSYSNSTLKAPKTPGNYYIQISSLGWWVASVTKVGGNLPYTVGTPTCSNGANNPPTCNSCASPKIWNGSSCVAACTNGANNPPTCNKCTSPLTWNGSSCVSACADGANNPPACNKCTAPLVWNGSSCVSSSSCANGANNPPSCNSCTAPLVWNGSSCTSGTPQNPPACTVLTATPSSISVNGTITLNWTCSNAPSCTAIPNADGFATGGKTTGSSTAIPTTTGSVTYGLSCGGKTFYFPPVTVTSPNVSITANPTRVDAGGSTTISWTSTNTKSCSVTKNGAAWKSGLNNSGIVDGNITGQVKYTITCTTSHAPVTDSVTVDVVPTFQEF